jgi:hypothetical protein
MSSFARKQLEKYGWKEGEGLGKNKQGISSFVRAVKPKGEKGEYIGIGHEASKGTSNSDMGFDRVLSEMAAASSAKAPKRERRENTASSSASDDEQAPKKNHRTEGEEAQAAATAAPKSKSGSSSSDSSSDDEQQEDGDITTWDDAKLFARCNGVRLGRGGRHRFFDGKVSRIADHNDKTSGTNPYEETALPKIIDFAKKKKHHK